MHNAGMKRESPLRGKRILYLGSSVTYGSASKGISFADFISQRNGALMHKEAVSGTTLVDGKNSYIERLKKTDPTVSPDLVVCQLSTNDATQNKPLGVPAWTDLPDTSTVCGAIICIIRYVRETWGCPIAFYTNAYYESENYANMVSAMRELARIYDVLLIDLYCDTAFNAIDEAERARYMADPIHPTREGYLKWWTPKMEAVLFARFGVTE
jgi:lysophospholipase L1-like esterase